VSEFNVPTGDIVFDKMAAFQDLDWSWLKNISQRLTESSLSAIHKLFEPGYVDNLLGKTATDAIRVLVDNEYLSTGAFLLICGME
jgi:hypothetical protein